MQEEAAAYLAFVVVASIYRVNRLIRSYQRSVGCRGKVYTPASYIILLLIYFSIILVAMIECFVVRVGQINLWLSLGGVIMYVGVIPLREKAISVLGKNMSPEVEIKKDHQLIKKGPYRWMRHPLVFCVIVELFGFALVSNSYYAFMGGLLVFLPYMLLRVYLEERALIEKFGDEYLQYKKEVCALLPLKTIKC